MQNVDESDLVCGKNLYSTGEIFKFYVKIHSEMKPLNCGQKICPPGVNTMCHSKVVDMLKSFSNKKFDAYYYLKSAIKLGHR